ncbi:MAG: S41 family peptidase [Finegoldia sp.]|nr:S41 family peptidase [Finegoldia sp.]
MAKNFKRKKFKFAPRFFIIIAVFLLLLIFLLFKYKSSKDIEFSDPLPESYMKKDLDVLIDLVEESYMNLPETLRYNNLDFIKSKSNFKRLISSKNTDSGFTGQNAVDTFNEILSNLYDKNVSVVGKNEYMELVKNKLPVSNERMATLRYKNIAEQEEYDSYSAFEVEDFDGGLYVKVKEFNKSDLKKESEIFRKILEDNEDRENLIIDLRDNDSDNPAYAIRVIMDNINTKNARANFYLAGKTKPVITKDLSDLGISSKVIAYEDSDLKIKDYDKDPSYLINFSLDLKDKGVAYDRVFILQNSKTKNSADLICQAAKDTGFAKTVGENTAGYGGNLDSQYHLLPYTGLIIKMPLGTGINPDGTSNEDVGTSPDIQMSDGDSMAYNLLNSIK